MKKTFALAALALATVAAPAAAQNGPTAVISITDLDLTQQADREKLDRRIESTARRVCDTGAFDAAARKLERACRLNIATDAAPKVRFAIAQAAHSRLASIALDVRG